MSGYTVDPSGIQSAAPLYDDQASALSDILNTLTGKLDGTWGCWGNDDAGSEFGKKYEPQARATLKNMADACRGLASTGDGVRQWAQNYNNANGAAIADLNTQLGS